MSDLPHVIVTEPLPRSSLSPLDGIARLTLLERLPDEQTLTEIVAEADALITRSGTNVTRRLLEAAPRLRVLGRAGVGIDNIDLESATERGIIVINVAGGNAVAVAELVFGSLLSLMRRILPAHQSVLKGEWDRPRFVGEELRGKTLGIVGLGRVGSEVARRAVAFDMRVLACDPYVIPSRFESLGVRSVSLDELLELSDIVSLHTPLTAETRGLFGAATLDRMKPGAYLINYARGNIVDEAALAERLVQGRLAGAAVDVYYKEPPSETPLRNAPNVILTPHIAGSTHQALDVIARTIAEQVALALQGLPVRGAVNLPDLTDQDWQTVGPLVPAAELVGLIYRDGLGGSLEGLEVNVRGHNLPSRRALEMLAGGVLKGLLEGVVDGPVNVVNAHRLAERRGLQVRLSSETDPAALVPVVTIRGGRRDGRAVSATLAPDGTLRLAGLEGLPLDLAITPTLLLTRHHDRPGMIGIVGGVLGRHGINIAAMQVARERVRGGAIMVMALDDPISSEVLAEIRNAPGIEEARSVDIPERLHNNAVGAAMAAAGVNGSAATTDAARQEGETSR